MIMSGDGISAFITEYIYAIWILILHFFFISIITSSNLIPVTTPKVKDTQNIDIFVKSTRFSQNLVLMRIKVIRCLKVTTNPVSNISEFSLLHSV